MGGRSDEFMTPKYVNKSFNTFLKLKNGRFGNVLGGKGHLAKHFEEEGFSCIWRL